MVLRASKPDRRALLKAAAAAALLAPLPAGAQAPAPPRRRPDDAAQGAQAMRSGGFSDARLARMREVMAGHVATGRMPGLVTLVSRRGEDACRGDRQSGLRQQCTHAARHDFRIASLTKPVTAAAAMMLVEDGKLRLDDPVDAWLPELKDRKVLRSLEGPLDDTVPANRAITLRDLQTFRLGLGAVMVFPPKYPIQQAMQDAGVAPGPQLPTLPPDELMRRYGSGCKSPARRVHLWVACSTVEQRLGRRRAA